MYIARQPIFNRQMEVYGYELLFRASANAKVFDGRSATKATASVLANLFESGITNIVDDKKVFINFNKELLESDLLRLVDKDRLVIEVLETVEVDDVLLDRMKVLKEEGYEMALDDFESDYKSYPLTPYAKIIKFDLFRTPLATIQDSVLRAQYDRKTILAEKIETIEDFQKAKDMGFQLFQGFFFSKPMIVGKKNDTKTTSMSQYFQLFQELEKEEPSYQVLAEIIERDVRLSYRLLYVVSSRAKGELIYSIKKALTFMGLKELDRWIRVLMIQELGQDKPRELIYMSLIRSKFAESIALVTYLKGAKYEAAMMGLFSTLDALLDMDMATAVKDLSLTEKVSSALVQYQGELAIIRRIMESYEQGDWSHLDRLSKLIKLYEEEVYSCYLSSVRWAKDVMHLIYE